TAVWPSQAMSTASGCRSLHMRNTFCAVMGTPLLKPSGQPSSLLVNICATAAASPGLKSATRRPCGAGAPETVSCRSDVLTINAPMRRQGQLFARGGRQIFSASALACFMHWIEKEEGCSLAGRAAPPLPPHDMNDPGYVARQWNRRQMTSRRSENSHRRLDCSCLDAEAKADPGKQAGRSLVDGGRRISVRCSVAASACPFHGLLCSRSRP